MVLKPNEAGCGCLRQFENDVKMYGTQAPERYRSQRQPFENDVKMYGTQAKCNGVLTVIEV